MAKRKLAFIAGAVALMTLAISARADSMAVAADGCAELARAVYDEVEAAATSGLRQAGPWVIGPPDRRVSICGSTTRTVSRAFRLAMASAGVDVRWADEPMNPGDFCLSGFLAQCYPRSRTPGGGSDPVEVMVREAWAAVSHAVMRSMANPYSSNEVRFDPDEMRLQIGLALRTVERVR